MIPYEVLNSITNSAAEPGNNWYVSGITRTHLTAETAIAIHDHLVKMRASHPLFGGFVMGWEYYPMVPRIMSVKPDATAFRMRTPDLGCLITLKWDGSVKDEDVKAKAKEVVTEHRIFCEKAIQAQPGYLPRADAADKDIGYGNYGTWTNPT
jgi:exoribonuclease II